MSTRDQNATYAWDRDADGIVTVTMDDPSGPVNLMNEHFARALAATVDRLENERDDITGVILASAKKSWFAGGDLKRLRAADPARAAQDTARVDEVKALLRRLETLGRPVVAAMNGTALGGGLEVALACHHRIATDVPGARFGVPEVSLGLLPGGGGVTRLVRMLGLQRALSEVILPATRFSAADALTVGIIDEVVPAADLDGAARAWISANPAPVKPWDEKGFALPGGGPTSLPVAGTLPAMPALLRTQTQGAPAPALRAAMAAAVEGAYVDVDTASTIETRYFISLTHTQVAKNMIDGYFDAQRVDAAAENEAFAARILTAFLAEAIAAVGEGVEPASLEQAALQAGYSAGALHRADEQGLRSVRAGLEAHPVQDGGAQTEHPAHGVLDWMIDEQQRPGGEAAAGFYEDDSSGGPRLWPGLRERFDSGRTALPLVDLQERMLFAQAIEAIRCLDAGIVAGAPEANVASVRGGVFPAWTGGVLRYISQYDGGIDGFVARSRELAAAYGDRLLLPGSLVAVAAGASVR